VANQQKRGSKAEDDAATHHSRYPARLHSHLTAAAEAAEAVSAPLPVEGDAGTPEELVSRYGGNGEPREADNE
jgi:transcriptional regulator of aromatic amino acid metabolism